MDGMLTKREGHSPCGRPPCCCIRALLPRTRLGFPLSAGPAWSQTGAARWWTRIDAQESEEGVRRQQGQTNISGNGRHASPGFHWGSLSYQLVNKSFHATHICNLTGQWNVSQVIWISQFTYLCGKEPIKSISKEEAKLGRWLDTLLSRSSRSVRFVGPV